MKKYIIVICLFFLYKLNGQETLVKNLKTNSKNIEINAKGIDEINIKNSKTNNLQISLFDANPFTHDILINDNSSILKIGFSIKFKPKNKVFKKFITKSINRASVIIYIPKNKEVTVLGNEIDLTSQNYNGNLNIYIEKGIVDLNKVMQSAKIKLFKGNVFAKISNFNIDIKSINGKILVFDKEYFKVRKIEDLNTTKVFKISSINANITLSSYNKL